MRYLLGVTPTAAPAIRTARADEYAAVGGLTVRAYTAGGLMPPDDPYLPRLGDARTRAAEAELLVAVDPTGRLVGTVTFARHGSPYAELAAPGEADFRMLAVDPDVRGGGIGAALVTECIRRARAAGADRLRLSTGAGMLAAQHIYARLGFVRTPELDWTPPAARHDLRTYVLDLTQRPRSDRLPE